MTPPHTGASAQQIIMKIVTAEPVSAAKLRKAVPPNVAAAVAKALEKLPADRFESASKFAEALVDPTYATAQSSAEHGVARERRWSRDPRSIGVASVAAVLGVALVWALTRPMPVEWTGGVRRRPPGQRGDDHGTGRGLRRRAERRLRRLSGEAVRGGAGALWYRSLRDRRAADRRHRARLASGDLAGRIEGGVPPLGAGNAWTLEWVSIDGGTPVLIGRGTGYADLTWLKDGELQVVSVKAGRQRGAMVRRRGWSRATSGKIGNCLMLVAHAGWKAACCAVACCGMFAHVVDVDSAGADQSHRSWNLLDRRQRQELDARAGRALPVGRRALSRLRLDGR